MKNNAFHNYFLRSKVNDQSINEKMIKVTLMVIPMVCQLQKVSSGKTVDLCSSNMRANYSNCHK